MAFRLLFRKPTNRVWEPKYDWADAVSKGIGKDVLKSLDKHIAQQPAKMKAMLKDRGYPRLKVSHNSLNSKDLGGACAKVPNTPRAAGLIKS